MSDKKDITILYVDDEEYNLLIFKVNFQTKFNVITAASGKAGLEELVKSQGDISVVISDMHMPEMNGVEFIQKAREQFDDITYFILSGFDYNEEIASAVDSKLVASYFKKPINLEEVEEAIDKANS